MNDFLWASVLGSLLLTAHHFDLTNAQTTIASNHKNDIKSLSDNEKAKANTRHSEQQQQKKDGDDKFFPDFNHGHGDEGHGGGGHETATAWASAEYGSSCNGAVFVGTNYADFDYNPSEAKHVEFNVPEETCIVVALKSFCTIRGSTAALVGSINYNNEAEIASAGDWKCVNYFPSGDWLQTWYDDSWWTSPLVYGANDGTSQYGQFNTITSTAEWLSLDTTEVICRKVLCKTNAEPTPSPTWWPTPG